MGVVSSVRHRSRARQRGAYAVEFALVVPVLFAVLLGTIEGGRFVVSRLMLSYAVVVGARAATLSAASNNSVQTAVINAAPMLRIVPAQVEITVSGGTPLPAPVGSTVTVSIGVVNPANKYTFRSVFGTAFTTRSWSAQSTVVTR